ncbi:MAG: xylulokinase [Opitutaceae bacterium]|nr:xylulokinase [Opitutaceae bacterium]|tara:strand:- start:6251 stop:7786 length:1536 start_codon:yes stop_codon:yes gene_type:complete
MNYLIGIDVGTSSMKTLLVDETGNVVGNVTESYPFETPKPLWSEQDPSLWWEATCVLIKRVLQETQIDASNVVGLGLTGQMHGLVLLDKDDQVLRPCILWNDQRTGKQCADITSKVGADRVLELTGNPVLPGFTAPKIAWVQENEPELFSKAVRFLLPKDYVRFLLSGEHFTDVSDASGTSLLNIGERDWSEEMCDVLGLSTSFLPTVTESPVASSKISATAAAATGLHEGTPIAAGGGDQAAQAVGSGIVKEGIVSATLGTSGVVFAHSDEYRVEPNGLLHAFCHAVPGKWHLMGVMLSAAGSFDWYKSTLGDVESVEADKTSKNVFDLLTLQAKTAPPGCEGLLFLPYLSGERTPHPDPDARGTFFGMTLRHEKAHMTRSVLEGITFGMNDSLQLMRDLGLEISEVRASGGGAKSEFWLQMQADIYGSRVVTTNVTEGAAFGAAVLAGVACGVYSNLEVAADKIVKNTGETNPGLNQAIYADYYPEYRALYPALKERFGSIGRVVEKHL